MFYYPLYFSIPQFVYYPCEPYEKTKHADSVVLRQDSTLDNRNINLQGLMDDDEKIFLTRQDLQKQGYQQTKKPWTKNQDRLLMKLCKDQNARFEQIAAQIQGRNAKMCYSRFRRLTYQTRVGWSKEEDEKLLELVSQLGDNSWKNFVPAFKGRSHKQIKDHYTNYLKPDLLKSQWTIEEDLELIRLINCHGKDWKIIESALEGRSRNQIKNRYFGKIVRLNRKKIEGKKQGQALLIGA